MAKLRDFVGELRGGALVVGVKLAASFAVVRAGFVALSDDDYSRVVIAQQFSLTPSWDPSGTSWLPFPFWLQGSILRAFSPSFELCRGVNIVAAAGALLVLYLVALQIGLKPRQAALGTTLAGLLPYSLLLGAATPPDGFCAALIAATILSLRSDKPSALLTGALAALIASLSRYESWPVALVFAGVVLWRSVHARQAQLLVPLALALVGPLGWMLHGALHHNSALFFVTRVTAYQHALGATLTSGWENALRTPLALLRFEPETVLLLLATLVLGRAHRIAEKSGDFARSPETAGPARFFGWGSILAAGALIVFLMVGDIRSSTATHHAERTLLSLWMLAALALTHELSRLWAKLNAPQWMLLAVAFVVGVLARVEGPGFGTLAPRNEERAIGTLARSLVPTGEQLAIWTTDYGYFAIQASFARPGTAQILDRHDPRTPHSNSPVRSANFGIFDRSLLLAGAREHCLAKELAANSKFVLARLAPQPSRSGDTDDPRCWP
ncbi:MAG: hypothetical protein SFV15_09035 [Polyangiaceae bacterium]|nr:hypothetical protein [Polyangiaceae bacterium]